jgi:hypothetical protein
MIFNYKLDRLPILIDRQHTTNTAYDSDNSLLVDYKFNDYGYRASFDYEPLLNSNKIVCIGCSFTEGVGLDEEETWPYLLSKQMGLPFLNLGKAGGSDGYVMWQIMNVFKNIQTTNIFVLSPPPGRFFELSDTNFESRQAWDVETATKSYSNFYDLNSFVLSALCDRYKLPHINSLQFGKGHRWTKAKDNQHFGYDYQTIIAKEFYKLSQYKLI